MTIGAGLLLIAAGAILRFAIATVSTHGVDLHTIGDILMAVGAVGLMLWLFVWGPWARARRGGYPRRPPQDPGGSPEAYRPGTRYPPEDGRYPPEDGRYSADGGWAPAPPRGRDDRR